MLTKISLRLLIRQNDVRLLMKQNFSITAAKNNNKINPNHKIRFDGRTAIITGGARGIGLEYAILLASRGANVVINDFGGARSGEQAQLDKPEDSIAYQVAKDVQEKFATGDSKILANIDTVSTEEGAKNIVNQTINKFGKVDILINNAGILRDKSFAKMTIDDWDQVQEVHLRGSFLVSHACWPVMRAQSFGRIIMTSSTSGIYGNFGQANYSAAKMGLIGLANTLAIEGGPKNIHTNVIVPMAASRLTDDIIPAELGAKLQPKYIAPMTVWLCHATCKENGLIYEAAGRWFGRHKMIRSQGKYITDLVDTDDLSLEKIESNLSEIGKFNKQNDQDIDSFNDHLADLMSTFENNK